VSSAHCAKPVAPSGWPFEMSPPEGLTTILPPYVCAPSSTNCPPFPSGQQAQRFVGDQLVAREAVVQLHDIHVLRPEARLFVRLLGGASCHVEPTSLMQLRSSKVLGRSVAMAMPAISMALPCSLCLRTEVFARQDRRPRSIRCRAALQLRERLVDHRRVLDLVEGVLGLEL